MTALLDKARISYSREERGFLTTGMRTGINSIRKGESAS